MKTNSKHISLVSALLVTFSFVSYNSISLASEKKNTIAKQTYPSNFANNYMKECMSQAVAHKDAAKFLQADAVSKLCICTLTQFQNKYDYTQYQALSWDAKVKEGYGCVQKLIFE